MSVSAKPILSVERSTDEAIVSVIFEMCATAMAIVLVRLRLAYGSEFVTGREMADQMAS